MRMIMTSISKLLWRFTPHATPAGTALAEYLAAEINRHPGLADRLLGMQLCAPSRRTTELRRVALRFRAKSETMDAADAVCRLMKPAIFDSVVPYLRGRVEHPKSVCWLS